VRKVAPASTMTLAQLPSAPERSGALVGIGLMLLGIFLFSVNDVMGKWLVATYSVGQVLLLRSIAALLVLSPVLARSGVSWIRHEQIALHLGRIALSTLEVACFYWAVAYLPLADVMTYYLASPIYVAAIAVFWLGERLDRPRVAAIAVGFAGVVIALKPSGATLTLPASIALAGSVFFAFLMILTRKLRATSDVTLVLGQILGALLFGIVAAPLTWVQPSARDFVLLSLLGIIAMVAHLCVNRSLKLAPASVVVPYQYTLIVWAIVLGYLVFGDVVQFWTLVGAAVICGAGLALLLIERRTARLQRPAVPATALPGAREPT
jgi:drug/metabolite transporter (DMT)-like permease